MRAHDPGIAGADHARGLDELLLAQREHLRPHDPRRVEPAEEAEDEHERDHPLGEDPEGDVVQPRPHRRAQSDDEEQRREDHRQFDHAGDRGVDPAAVVARDCAEEDADQHDPDRRQDGDLERNPRAVEQAQELVVAELPVGAEDVELGPLRVAHAAARRRRESRARDVAQRADRELAEAAQAGAQVEVVRAVTQEVGGYGAARDRDEDEEDDEAAAEDRDLVAAEAAPDLLPVTAGANRFDFPELSVRFDRDRRRESGLGADELALSLLGRHRFAEYS